MKKQDLIQASSPVAVKSKPTLYAVNVHSSSHTTGQQQFNTLCAEEAVLIAAASKCASAIPWRLCALTLLLNGATSELRALQVTTLPGHIERFGGRTAGGEDGRRASTPAFRNLLMPEV